MLRMTIEVDGDAADEIGAKEQICMLLEKYGAARVVKIECIQPQQMSLYGGNEKC